MYIKRDTFDVKDVFRNELPLITDDNVREFTVYCLSKAPAYWWEAHSSKVHHFKDERKRGGRILHAKRVFRVADMMCEAHSITGKKRDYVLSAALVHDTCIWGLDDKPWSQKAMPNHPLMAVMHVKWCFDTFVKEFELKYQNTCKPGITNEDSLTICSIIHTHMGKWGTEPPQTVEQWVLHEADMVASREYIKVIPLKKK